MPLKCALHPIPSAIIATAWLVFSAYSAGAACPPPAAAEADVTVAMTAAAAKTDDLEGFHAVTTPDFYAFENGKRFDGDALMQLIKTAHAGGTRYEWSVTQPRVEADCGMALITYVNVGSITVNGVPQAMSWLESAELGFEGGRWRIHFFSSTRVPQPQPVAK
jgi:hypothetical protein